jgi:hypothetical protein
MPTALTIIIVALMAAVALSTRRMANQAVRDARTRDTGK